MQINDKIWTLQWYSHILIPNVDRFKPHTSKTSSSWTFKHKQRWFGTQTQTKKIDILVCTKCDGICISIHSFIQTKKNIQLATKFSDKTATKVSDKTDKFRTIKLRFHTHTVAQTHRKRKTIVRSFPRVSCRAIRSPAGRWRRLPRRSRRRNLQNQPHNPFETQGMLHYRCSFLQDRLPRYHQICNTFKL